MDSFLAEEMKPQVLTTRTAAESASGASCHPALSRAAIMSSESTWFFAQPRLSTWKVFAGSVERRDLEDIAARGVLAPGHPAGGDLSQPAQLDIAAARPHARGTGVGHPHGDLPLRVK